MRKGRAVVVVPADRQSIDAASGLLADLRHRYPRLNFVFVADSPALRAWLSARFPSDRVVPFPSPLGPLPEWFLERLRTQLLLVLGAMTSPAELLLARALACETAGVVVRGEPGVPPGRPQGGDGPMLYTLQVHAPDGAGIPGTGPQRAMPPDRHRIVAPLEQAPLDEIADRLVPLIAYERPERSSRPARLLAGLVWDRLTTAPEDRFVAGLLKRKYRAFATVDQLGAALGHPRTILCLGNGPSAEDPRVTGVDFDCLFRVNHSWLERGILTQPDAVYTGAMPTIRAIHRPVIFCLHNRRAEERLILRSLFRCGRVRFASIERYGLIDAARFGSHQPTNGVMMLATAVALAPERLIVAGIDLFQDPRGAYPGGGSTPNAYAPAHDRDIELEVILSLLGSYDGELLILSEVLNNYWRAYQTEARPVAANDRGVLSRTTTAV